MPSLDQDTLAQLMTQFAKDMEASARLAEAAAASAKYNAETGRINADFQDILEAEPHINHARTLIGIAGYVSELDSGSKSE